MYHKPTKKLNPREMWVLDKPEYFTVISYRPKRQYFQVPTYKQAIKLFLQAKKKSTTGLYLPLVYAIRGNGMANLNHRKTLS